LLIYLSHHTTTADSTPTTTI